MYGAAERCKHIGFYTPIAFYVSVSSVYQYGQLFIIIITAVINSVNYSIVYAECGKLKNVRYCSSKYL